MITLTNYFIPSSILWLVFLVVAFLVIFCSTKMSKYLAGISEKSTLGGAFLGAFVLSMVTSIPEIVSGITASCLDNPILSYGNVLGVNMMTLTFLAILDIIFIKKTLFSKISKTNKKTILYVFGYNILMLISLFVPSEYTTINLWGFKFSYIYLIMFALYVFYVYRIYKLGKDENDEEAEESGCGNLPLWKIVVRFVLYALALIGCAIAIAYVTDQMASDVPGYGYNLGSAMAGALFLSVCTGLPEMTSAVSLARMGQGNIALGGIIGSHFFNFIIFFFGDIAYTKANTVQVLKDNPEQYVTIILTCIVGMVLNLLLFSNTFKKNVKNKFIYILPCVIIIALYLTFWFTKDGLVSLFIK